MYNIGTLNKISPVGLATFNDKYTITEDLESCSGIMVRSMDLHDMDFSPSLLAIARAGAGVNNIPLERCADEGIVVFNAPGANANAVKELTIAALIMASRNIPAAIKWAQELEADPIAPAIEKGKGQFAGCEIKGKTLGVLGLGAIGQEVANACLGLGMKVIGYDPYLSMKSALKLNPEVEVTDSLEKMLAEADYVTIHIPVMDSTKESIDKDFFDLMKDGAVLVNLSRDKLVKEEDLIVALDNNKISTYVIDFATDKLCKRKDVITLPHLGASTAEAEDNCASMAAAELMDYIECGNITNSVNFPNVSLGPLDDYNRVAIITKGEPYPDKLIAAMFADKKIHAIAGATRGLYGYALIATTDMITLGTSVIISVVAIRA